MVSIGANDVRFLSVVEGCLTTASCHTGPIATEFDQRIAELPLRYDRLAGGFDALGIDANRVFITEYFDPTSNDQRIASMRCALDPGTLGRLIPVVAAGSLFAKLLNGGEILDDDEAAWAQSHVMGRLNGAVSAAATAHGWRFVAGIARQFEGHGYCATDHKVVRLGESVVEQGNQFGAFHPNRAGQQIYGTELFGALRRRTTVPDPSTETGATVGTSSVGDLAVVTASRTTVTSAAIRSTGGAPLVGTVRRLDRITSGDGFLGPGGVPAVDRNAVVAAWTELSGSGNFTTQALVAQVGVHPNVGVESVRIVQAPDDGSIMVAGRDSVVLAVIDADTVEDVTVDVTTAVSAIDDLTGAEQMLFLPVTEPIELHPGRNTLILPVDETFRPDEDSTVQARVTVTDPQGATADDAVDNTGEASGPNAVRSVASREVNVAVGRLDLGAATVGCTTVGTLANKQVSFAGAAMPVRAGEVGASLFCQPIPGVEQSRDGIAALVVDLDEQARYAALDAVVAVVPAGWLSSTLDGAVGVSAAGLRGVIVEAGTPDHTLAHELTHSLGRSGHTSTAIEASGVRVDRNASARRDRLDVLAHTASGVDRRGDVGRAVRSPRWAAQLAGATRARRQRCVGARRRRSAAGPTTAPDRRPVPPRHRVAGPGPVRPRRTPTGTTHRHAHRCRRRPDRARREDRAGAGRWPVRCCHTDRTGTESLGIRPADRAAARYGRAPIRARRHDGRHPSDR